MVDERKRIARRIEQGENSNGLRERQTSLERGLSSLRAEVEELDQQARRQWVLALADDPFNTIADDVALRGGPSVVRPGRREPLPSPLGLGSRSRARAPLRAPRCARSTTTVVRMCSPPATPIAWPTSSPRTLRASTRATRRRRRHGALGASIVERMTVVTLHQGGER